MRDDGGSGHEPKQAKIDAQGNLEIGGTEQNNIDTQLARKRKIWEEFKSGLDEKSVELLTAEGAGKDFFEESLVNWGKLEVWVLAKYGGPDEVEDLLLQHKNDITGWLRKAGVTRHQDLEDCSQEVSLRVHKSVSGADGPRLYGYMAWLRTITTNVAFDLYNREKKHSVVELAPEADEEAEAGTGKAVDMLASREILRWSRDAQAAMDLRIDFERLSAQLPSQMRAVLYMFLRGHKQKEIADELQISPAIVQRLLQQIKDRFKIFFQKPSKGGQNDANATH